MFGNIFFLQFLAIKNPGSGLDPDPYLYPYPDPDSINPDPQLCQKLKIAGM
jgi:hypothetical protein